jgi:hypothetical protein
METNWPGAGGIKGRKKEEPNRPGRSESYQFFYTREKRAADFNVTVFVSQNEASVIAPVITAVSPRAEKMINFTQVFNRFFHF